LYSEASAINGLNNRFGLRLDDNRIFEKSYFYLSLGYSEEIISSLFSQLKMIQLNICKLPSNYEQILLSLLDNLGNCSHYAHPLTILLQDQDVPIFKNMKSSQFK